MCLKNQILQRHWTVDSHEGRRRKIFPQKRRLYITKIEITSLFSQIKDRIIVSI